MKLLNYIVFFFYINNFCNNVGIFAHYERNKNIFWKSDENNSLKGGNVHFINISYNVYVTIDNVNQAKTILQNYMENFLENLQRNITISTTTLVNNYDEKFYDNQLLKLNDLAESFKYSAKIMTAFIFKLTQFFNVMQNETNYLLEKFKEISTITQQQQQKTYFRNTNFETDLDNYFDEVDYFRSTLNDTIHSILDYIIYNLSSIKNVFQEYADIQENMLIKGNLKIDKMCYTKYTNFLQKWSADIFKCSCSSNLSKVYDIHAITEITLKHIIEQIVYRIWKIYNCFIFNNFQLRCKFIKNPEKDFENLFIKLDELHQYLDRIYKSQRINKQLNWSWHQNNMNEYIEREVCIPQNFPIEQMSSYLKSCFNFLM